MGDVEKGERKGEKAAGLSAKGDEERDSDGVLVENEVPIVRMKGPDDPDS